MITVNSLLQYRHVKQETMITYRQYCSMSCQYFNIRPSDIEAFMKGSNADKLYRSAVKKHNAKDAVELALRWVAML